MKNILFKIERSYFPEDSNSLQTLFKLSSNSLQTLFKLSSNSLQTLKFKIDLKKYKT